jgi:hypothetical protein
MYSNWYVPRGDSDSFGHGFVMYLEVIVDMMVIRHLPEGDC